MAYSPATTGLLEQRGNIAVYEAHASLADPACIFTRHLICLYCEAFIGSTATDPDKISTEIDSFYKQHLHAPSAAWFKDVAETASKNYEDFINDKSNQELVG